MSGKIIHQYISDEQMKWHHEQGYTFRWTQTGALEAIPPIKKINWAKIIVTMSFYIIVLLSLLYLLVDYFVPGSLFAILVQNAIN